MHCVCGHCFPLHHARQLLCEIDVGQFAAAVGEEREQVVVQVLEVEPLVLVVGAGQRDHSAGGAFLQPRKQQVGEEEVPQVIHTKTHGETVISPIQDTGHTWTFHKDKKEHVIQ